MDRPERRVHRMTGDVAERAGSDIPPAAPLEWRIGRIVRPLGHGTEPQIPVQGRGRVVLLEGTIERLGPDRPVGPELDLPHRSDETRLDPLANQACAFFGVTLIPHLRRDLGFARPVFELLYLPQRPR